MRKTPFPLHGRCCWLDSSFFVFIQPDQKNTISVDGSKKRRRQDKTRRIKQSSYLLSSYLFFSFPSPYLNKFQELFGGVKGALDDCQQLARLGKRLGTTHAPSSLTRDFSKLSWEGQILWIGGPKVASVFKRSFDLSRRILSLN